MTPADDYVARLRAYNKAREAFPATTDEMLEVEHLRGLDDAWYELTDVDREQVRKLLKECP